MSVSALSSGSQSLLQIFQSSFAAQSTGNPVGGASDASLPLSAPQGSTRSGGIIDAVIQALSQIGVSGAPSSDGADASSASPSAPTDIGQALHSFMHNLFSALHAQHKGQTDSDGNNDGSQAAGAAAESPQGHHRGNIAADLQSLIGQLTSSAGNTDSTTTPLQQSFQSLLTALGNSDPQATLGNFLQAFSQDLPGANPLGNVISTQA